LKPSWKFLIYVAASWVAVTSCYAQSQMKLDEIALWKAITADDVDQVDVLLTKGYVKVNALPTYIRKRSWLSSACQFGAEDVYKYLVRNGADVLKIWTNESGTRENAVVGCLEGNAVTGNTVPYFFEQDFRNAISKTNNPKQVYKEQYTVLSIPYQKFPEYGGLLHYILFGQQDNICLVNARWMVAHGADVRQFIGVEQGLTDPRIPNHECQQFLKSEFDKVVPNK
jgi:hypothetical protein